MKTAGSALLVCLGLLWQLAAHAELIAEVDRSRLSIEDSVTLTLRATDDEDVEAVDLSALEPDFVIGRASRNTQLSIVNGRRELVSELVIPLFPRHTGKLQIPALTANGRVSRPIDIRVEAGRTAIDSNTEVFVEVEVDRKTAYVQAQILYRFTLYRAVNLDDLRLTPLELPDLVVQELDTQTFQRNIDGRTFQATQVSYALFPQRSGPMTLPSLTFTARARGPRQGLLSLGNPGKPLRRRTAQIELNIRPIPSAFPDSAWLPAAALQIEEHWSKSPDLLSLGESSTRTLTITATGLDGKQLPEIELEQPAGIKLYPDQAHSENISGNGGITGLGITSAALLVTAPGDYELPAIRIPWWDTASNSLRYAEVPAWRFSIAQKALPVDTGLPAPAVIEGLSTTPAGAGSSSLIDSQSPLWLWTTIAALLGWAMTSLWLWRRPAVARDPSLAVALDQARESTLFKQLVSACQQNQARTCRRALLAWAQSHFATNSSPTISELAARSDAAEVRGLLLELEQSLYSSDAGSWHGGPMLDALRRWRTQSQRVPGGKRDSLPPLYS
jgi:hypothetical protein